MVLCGSTHVLLEGSSPHQRRVTWDDDLSGSLQQQNNYGIDILDMDPRADGSIDLEDNIVHSIPRRPAEISRIISTDRSRSITGKLLGARCLNDICSIADNARHHALDVG